MAKKNGWKKITAAAVGIVAIGGAWMVLKPYINLDIAPAITFVWASENSLARLDNQLFSYEELLERARDKGDAKAIRRQTKNVKDTERKIEEVEAEIKKKKK